MMSCLKVLTLLIKKWIKTTGDPIEHFDGVKIPQVLEILDPSAVITDYLTDD